MLPLAWATAVSATALVASMLAPAGPASSPVVEPQRAAAPARAKVLLISVDSLGSRAMRKAGRDGAPNLYRLMDEGASTLNARTVRELTLTLPNHTSIVTGRPVDGDRGHDVDWNDERSSPRTIHRAAGRRVGSVFTTVASHRRDPASFVSKDKLSLFRRSWPKAFGRFVVQTDNRNLVRRTRIDLVKHRRPLTFLHLSLPDNIGHAEGFLSEEHLAAVSRVDGWIGTLLSAVEKRPRLRSRLSVIVTTDHGGKGGGHHDQTKVSNYRIPFLVWGAGVTPGADLYDLNPDYRNPKSRRTRYGIKRPPVRNADAANLALDLLGLPAIRGSTFNRRQRLDVAS